VGGRQAGSGAGERHCMRLAEVCAIPALFLVKCENNAKTLSAFACILFSQKTHDLAVSFFLPQQIYSHPIIAKLVELCPPASKKILNTGEKDCSNGPAGDTYRTYETESVLCIRLLLYAFVTFTFVECR